MSSFGGESSLDFVEEKEIHENNQDVSPSLMEDISYLKMVQTVKSPIDHGQVDFQ